MKPYNNLSDIEKGWIREYKSWCKCARENPELLEYAWTQTEHYTRLLAARGLNVHNY